MSELPDTIRITEEGPREGFQIESSDIATDRKIALIDALSATGVPMIQVCSFVNPKLVPGWADAEAVVRGFTPQRGRQVRSALVQRARLPIAHVNMPIG